MFFHTETRRRTGYGKRDAIGFASFVLALRGQRGGPAARRDGSGLHPFVCETSARIIVGAFPLYAAGISGPHSQALLQSTSAHRQLMWGSGRAGSAVARAPQGNRGELELGERWRRTHVLSAVRTPVRAYLSTTGGAEPAPGRCQGVARHRMILCSATTPSRLRITHHVATASHASWLSSTTVADLQRTLRFLEDHRSLPLLT
jgi:hypothetical protein